MKRIKRIMVKRNGEWIYIEELYCALVVAYSVSYGLKSEFNKYGIAHNLHEVIVTGNMFNEYIDSDSNYKGYVVTTKNKVISLNRMQIIYNINMSLSVMETINKNNVTEEQELKIRLLQDKHFGNLIELQDNEIMIAEGIVNKINTTNNNHPVLQFIKMSIEDIVIKR